MNCYFFGTFNPIHIGHIEIARQVKELLNFDKVIFVPAYMPPHKVMGIESFVNRFEMVKLSVGQDCVSDIERRLKPPSYTYRTIEKLLEEEKTQRINFIIGYDQFFKLESWREPEFLKEKLNFIVIPRKFQNGQVMSEKAFDYFKNKGYQFNILNINFLDVSSEMIRELVSQNQEIAGIVSREVKEYIEINRLYKNVARNKSII